MRQNTILILLPATNMVTVFVVVDVLHEITLSWYDSGTWYILAFDVTVKLFPKNVLCLLAVSLLLDI